MANIHSPSAVASISEKSETVEATSILLEYERQGYVFHGSADPSIKVLEPKAPVHNAWLDEFMDSKGIFAAANVIGAIVFACMSRSKIPAEVSNGTWEVGPDYEHHTIWAKIPMKWKEYIVDNVGYVYVLKKDSFHNPEGIDNSWQVKSAESVTPVDKVTVKFSDFEKLGGIVKWESEPESEEQCDSSGAIVSNTI